MLFTNISGSIILDNDIHFVYQEHSEPYDFVSIMIDAGYYNAYSSISGIINYMTGKVDIKGSNDYDIMPLYSSVNYYLDSGTADDLLIEILNSGLYDNHSAVPYIPANEMDKALKMRMRFSGNVFKHFNIKNISVKSSIDKNIILEIINKYPKIYSDNYLTNIPLLMGTFNITNIENEVHFYDFNIKDIYCITDVLYFYYYLLKTNHSAKIRYLYDYAIIMSNEPVKTKVSHNDFQLIKNEMLMFYNNALNDVHFQTIFSPYLLYKGNTNYILGMKNKAEKVSFNEFKTIINKKSSCIFTNKKKYLPDYNISETTLKNGITVLYRNSPNHTTEISILIKNVLQNEHYYSKTFASDIVFNEILNRTNRWFVMPYSTLSDIRMFTGIFDNLFIETEINSLFNVFNEDISKFDRTIINRFNKYAESFPRKDTIIKTNYLNNRITVLDDALYLTNGEINLLKKKIFYPGNIIISVSTKMPENEILSMISESSQQTDNYYLPIMELPIIEPDENEIAFFDKWYNNLENSKMILSAFLNYPSSIVINRKYALISTYLLINAEKYSNNLYFNIMNRGAMTILPALSHYLFNDNTKCFELLGISESSK